MMTRMRLEKTSDVAAVPARSPAGGLLGYEVAPGWLLHTSFAMLLVISAIRYLTRHIWGPQSIGVLLLSLSVAILYAYCSSSRHQSSIPRVALIAVWTALVLLAPSFSWCAFVLFFHCLQWKPIRAVPWALLGVLLPTVTGLFLMTSGEDYSVLVAPLTAGALVYLVHLRLVSETAARYDLMREVNGIEKTLEQSRHRTELLSERAFLAKELHDAVAQSMASSLLHVEAARQMTRDTDVQANLERALLEQRRSLQGIRSLVHDRSVISPHEVPLEESLLHEVRAYIPDATLVVDGTAPTIPQDISHALTRVAQSAAANILLHAQASSTRVALSFQSDNVCLDIFDDGVGFDPSDVGEPGPQGGYGILAMRRRVEHFGGKLDIESTPGMGTIIAAQIPLPLLTRRESQ